MLLPLKVAREGEKGPEFVSLINPAELKTAGAQAFSDKKAAGTTREGPPPRASKNEKLSFSLTLDGTGVVPLRSGVAATVEQQLKALDDVLGVLDVTNGEPLPIPWLKISWGDFIYRGRIERSSTVFTLFSPGGRPLRAKVDLSFTVGSEAPPTPTPTAADGTSRQVSVRADQSLPALCQAAYGDAIDCEGIARLNDLESLRELPMDVDIFMPGLSEER